VRIYVPVSLRRRGRGPQQGNLIAQMVIPLPLGGCDPGRRLRQIAAETAKRKARTRTSLGTLFRGRITRRLLLKAIIRQRVNVTSASIPGPKVPLYLAGARVLEVFPVLPLIANEPLGIGALSYAGTFTVGVVADRDAYPDLAVFAAGVREELHALGVSTDPTSGRPVGALSARPSRDGRPVVDAGDDCVLVAHAAGQIRTQVTYEQRQP
jgi:diacylglycerol O-acyltransferase